MIEEINDDARARMKKSIEALKHELSKIRTGRAHPSLLDHIKVDYYGSEVPLAQAANVSAEDSRTLAVTPWASIFSTWHCRSVTAPISRLAAGVIRW
jgi:ribosome recycling factor